MTSLLPRISLLPEHLIDQIKAGEVIERPGNLIKEILENAIDAGATKLELTLRNNGLDLISLKDNGHGILAEDLSLAFSRHATSKIDRFEDLYRLKSYGFRGEALASMAAISKLQCISFTQESSVGAEIRIEGGLTTFEGKRNKTTVIHGTELVIQDLFFNTPARLKFIQSQQAEKNFIKKIVQAFILSNPKIEFTFKMDEEEREVYSSQPDIKGRLLDIIPKSKDLILHSQKSYEEKQLELILLPGNIRVPNKFQNIYINGRYVLDKQLHRVLTQSLLSSFGVEDFNFLLFLHLPSDHVDVNVHPNKTIIKIFETSKLIALMTATIKELAAQGTTSAAGLSPPRPIGLLGTDEHPSLAQGRHEYNFEGHFSPHNLPLEKKDHFHWVGNYFLRNLDDHWEVCLASRLLSHFVEKKLKTPTLVIPLLVSEPFKLSKLDPKRIKHLIDSGLELENLGTDTIVLRSIPEWMNGFPLKEVVQLILEDKSLIHLTINPKDWSQSTWEDMLNAFSPQELRENKISFELKHLLEERFK